MCGYTQRLFIYTFFGWDHFNNVFIITTLGLLNRMSMQSCRDVQPTDESKLCIQYWQDPTAVTSGWYICVTVVTLEWTHDPETGCTTWPAASEYCYMSVVSGRYYVNHTVPGTQDFSATGFKRTPYCYVDVVYSALSVSPLASTANFSSSMQ